MREDTAVTQTDLHVSYNSKLSVKLLSYLFWAKHVVVYEIRFKGHQGICFKSKVVLISEVILEKSVEISEIFIVPSRYIITTDVLNSHAFFPKHYISLLPFPHIFLVLNIMHHN